MAEDVYAKGVPSMVLLPAKNYVFKVNEDKFMATIPRKGKYHDLDPEFFPEDSGEFNILDTKNGALYIPSIIKVLFATKQYPDLKFNQFIAISVLQFLKDKVVVAGEIIDMMIPTND